jgi:transcriptional regulator with XRE-family HTH domain
VTHAEVIGARLRKARADRSGHAIGEALGVTAQTVYRWESGVISVPPDRYHAIAECLGVPWAELFDPTPAVA